MATYEQDFKVAAVKLSKEIGVKKAAERLGIPHSTLADWRYKQPSGGDPAHAGRGRTHEVEDKKNQRIWWLEHEIKELQRKNEILQDTIIFIAKSLDKSKSEMALTRRHAVKKKSGSETPTMRIRGRKTS